MEGNDGINVYLSVRCPMEGGVHCFTSSHSECKLNCYETQFTVILEAVSVISHLCESGETKEQKHFGKSTTAGWLS